MVTCTEENHVVADCENFTWIEGDLDIYDGELVWRNGAYGVVCMCEKQVYFQCDDPNCPC